MNHCRRFLWVCFLVLVCKPSLWARTYKIGVVSWVGWASIHVADTQGLFKAKGLDVAVQWYPGPKEVEDAFQSGDIDFRLDFLGSVFDAVQNGDDLVLLAETTWSNGGDKILVREGSSFAAGKGMVVAVYRDTPALAYFLHLYLRGLGQGKSVGDFKLRQMEPDAMLSDFKEDRLNFAISFDPYTIPMVREGGGKVVANSSQFPGCLPEGIYAKRANLKTIPMADQIGLMQALVAAANWIDNKKNFPAFTGILNQHVLRDQKDFSPKNLRAMMVSVRIHNSKVLRARNTDKGGALRYLEQLEAFMKRQGLLKREVHAVDIFDNRAIRAALE